MELSRFVIPIAFTLLWNKKIEEGFNVKLVNDAEQMKLKEKARYRYDESTFMLSIKLTC